MRQQANSVLAELAEQKLLRAVYSDRQLQEVLTDFWFNHFNVDARKNRARFLLTVVRARRHPPARARHVPRSARSDREGSGDARLSRQLDERGGNRPPDAMPASTVVRQQPVALASSARGRREG